MIYNTLTNSIQTSTEEENSELNFGCFNGEYRKKIIAKFNLPVKIDQLDDYYIVIITGFYTRNETFRYYPEFAGMGFPKTLILEKTK